MRSPFGSRFPGSRARLRRARGPTSHRPIMDHPADDRHPVSVLVWAPWRALGAVAAVALLAGPAGAWIDSGPGAHVPPAAVASASTRVTGSTQPSGRIAFDSDRSGGGLQVFTMNGDGSDVQQLTFVADSVDPAFSPDGSRIAFASDRTGQFDIWLIDADGSGITQLTTNPAFDGQPTWSADGSKIAFSSNRGGDMEIFTMDDSGANQVAFTADTVYEADPAWSPDGTTIAYTS